MRKKKSKKDEVKIKEKITEALELPRDIVLDEPKIYLTGDSELILENYKGIIDYDENSFKANSKCGVIKIEGADLSIKNITDESVLLKGKIKYIQYIN